ncbi:MAG TPA: VanZ family protein [Bacillaceae bacterium]
MNITFPLVPLGAVLLLIYFVSDTKRNGLGHLWHRLIFYSFLVYILSVVHLTIGGITFPLIQDSNRIAVQPIPFFFVWDWVRLYGLNGADFFFWNSVKLYALNVLLLLPLGVYLSVKFQIRSAKKAILILFLSSLMIETLQLVLTWIGLIRPRSFDADDLLLNTLGGVIGFWIWEGLRKLSGVIRKVPVAMK